MSKRVVITGMSLVSALGNDIDAAFNRLQKYENCVEYYKELEEYSRLNTRLCAPIHDYKHPEDFNRKVTRTMGEVSIMSVDTARKALIDAGLYNDEIIKNGQTGVAYGSSTGSLDAIIDFYSMQVDKEVKNINSGSYVKMMPQTTAVNISLYFGTTGRIIPTSTACTSGSMGIGAAYEAIKDGYQTVMIAGGAEELNVAHIAVFDVLFATSTKNNTPKLSPSPFDKNRDGLVIGAGAGTLILEEYEHAKNRGAKIYAEVIGYGTTTDGTHITNPNPNTMKNAMIFALKDAKLNPEDIGYVNAHGTATIQGDIAETTATYDVFKRNIPISTIKSYTGHTLGACGAIETVLTVKMMENNWYNPNLNLTEVDEKCPPLGYIKNEGVNLNTNIVMTNNFAFGGINTSLILKRV